MSKNSILLSCLIATIPDRRTGMLSTMLDKLEQQAKNLPVEILAFYDNRRRTVGEKRNALLREAKGDFIVYLDDDDQIVEDYIPTILSVIVNNRNADCIVYDQICRRPGRSDLLCKYGLEFRYRETKHFWEGKPAHTMPWRRDLANQVAFSDVSYGEDTNWVIRACRLAKREVRIDRVMYFYDFNPATSGTRRPPVPIDYTDYIMPVEVKKSPNPELSVVIATRNKPAQLTTSLESIVAQKPPFVYEVIVVDDGSEEATRTVCDRLISYGHPIRYFRMENGEYRNPGFARNLGYKKAKGAVIVAQSDDVKHMTQNTLELLADIKPGTFNIATVWNVNQYGKLAECYTGVRNKRPLFFLGSMMREHCYAIGGNCEEFTEPGYEDDWFGKCLMRGLNLQPVFREDVVGHHQDHPRPPLAQAYHRMRLIFDRKYGRACEGLEPWIGGPAWPLEESTDPEIENHAA